MSERYIHGLEAIPVSLSPPQTAKKMTLDRDIASRMSAAVASWAFTFFQNSDWAEEFIDWFKGSQAVDELGHPDILFAAAIQGSSGELILLSDRSKMFPLFRSEGEAERHIAASRASYFRKQDVVTALIAKHGVDVASFYGAAMDLGFGTAIAGLAPGSPNGIGVENFDRIIALADHIALISQGTLGPSLQVPVFNEKMRIAAEAMNIPIASPVVIPVFASCVNPVMDLNGADMPMEIDSVFYSKQDGSRALWRVRSASQVRPATRGIAAMSRSVATLSESDQCGAGSPGGAGFSIGNTCATAGSGDAETSKQRRDMIRQWAIENFKTPSVAANFMNWFGESLVTTDGGIPLKVYHGGSFDPADDPTLVIGESGMHFGTKAAAEERMAEKPYDDMIKSIEIEQDPENLRYYWTVGGASSYDERSEQGFDFADEAHADAEAFVLDMYDRGSLESDEDSKVVEVYLRIENPKIVEDAADSWPEEIKKAKEEGHDGIFYTNDYEDTGSLSYIIFEPSQAKLASGNDAFSTTSASVLESDECGAGSPGGKGFEPGNTCAKVSGSGSVATSSSDRIKQWAKEKFGEGAAENFAQWFGESKIVDEAGDPQESEPLVVYHGTTHEFNAFDMQKASAESDMGPGFYFSESMSDSEVNYGPEGTDLRNRVGQLADDLEGEFSFDQESEWTHESLESEVGISDEAVRERVLAMIAAGADPNEIALVVAEDKLVGKSPKVIKAYLSIKNPVVLGNPVWGKSLRNASPGETSFTVSYNEEDSEGRTREDPDFDEDTAEIIGIEGTLPKLLDSVSTKASDYGVDISQQVDELISEVVEYESISAGQLMSRIKSFDGWYDASERGLVGTILQKSLQELGYDGVVYQDANEHFPNFGAVTGEEIPPGTRHFIAWDPSQIKSVKNKGTFSKSSSNIYEAAAKADECGAGSPGGAGFEKGNTCAKGEKAKKKQEAPAKPKYRAKTAEDKRLLEADAEAEGFARSFASLMTPEIMEKMEELRAKRKEIAEAQENEGVSQIIEQQYLFQKMYTQNAVLSKIVEKIGSGEDLNSKDVDKILRASQSPDEESADATDAEDFKEIEAYLAKIANKEKLTKGETAIVSEFLKNKIATNLVAREEAKQKRLSLKETHKESWAKYEGLLKQLGSAAGGGTGLHGELAKMMPDIGELQSRKVVSVGKFMSGIASSRVGKVLEQPEKDDRPDVYAKKVDVIAHALAEDINLASSRKDSGAEWYGSTVDKAIRHLSKVHPELQTDDVKKEMFLSFVAITSNGQAVDDNFVRAEQLYSNYKKTGKVDFNGVFGGQTREAINMSLRRMSGMIEAFERQSPGDGEKMFIDFMRKPYAVGELTKYMADSGFIKKGESAVAGERVSYSVRGSMIFGPKIGAFFSNLRGDSGFLTMDRWFMRSFNRITGSLVQTDPGAVKKKASRVLDLLPHLPNEMLHGFKRSTLQSEAAAAAGGKKLTAQSSLAQWSKRRVAEYSKSDFEDHAIISYTDASGKQKSDSVNLAGKEFWLIYGGMNEAPDNATQRDWIREAFGKSLQIVERKYGKKMDVASAQAALWFLEKDIYSAFLAKTDSKAAPADYEDAAIHTLRRLGKPAKKGIFESLDPAAREYYGASDGIDDVDQMAFDLAVEDGDYDSLVSDIMDSFRDDFFLSQVMESVGGCGAGSPGGLGFTRGNTCAKDLSVPTDTNSLSDDSKADLDKGEWRYLGDEKGLGADSVAYDPRPYWVQSYGGALKDAIASWKSDPGAMQRAMRAELDGQPQNSGNEKIDRVRARALMLALVSGKPAPTLYRGDNKDPQAIDDVAIGWTSSKKTATAFAKKYGGKVYTKPSGALGIQAPGLGESEWIVIQDKYLPLVKSHAQSIEGGFRLKESIVEEADSCGAGSPGGKGFEKGNTCAASSASATNSTAAEAGLTDRLGLMDSISNHNRAATLISQNGGVDAAMQMAAKIAVATAVERNLRVRGAISTLDGEQFDRLVTYNNILRSELDAHLSYLYIGDQKKAEKFKADWNAKIEGEVAKVLSSSSNSNDLVAMQSSFDYDELEVSKELSGRVDAEIKKRRSAARETIAGLSLAEMLKMKDKAYAQLDAITAREIRYYIEDQIKVNPDKFYSQAPKVQSHSKELSQDIVSAFDGKEELHKAVGVPDLGAGQESFAAYAESLLSDAEAYAFAKALSKHRRYPLKGDASKKDTLEYSGETLNDVWAISSTARVPSIAMQIAVANKFGMDSEAISGAPAKQRLEAKSLYAENKKAIDAYVDAIYQNTQKWFAEKGIKEVAVFRGMAFIEDQQSSEQDSAGVALAAINAHGIVRQKPNSEAGKRNAWVVDSSVKTNPLSSFSYSSAVASGFAENEGGISAMVVAKVPVEKIFSLAGTGPGSHSEEEVLVIGHDMKAKTIYTKDVAPKSDAAIAAALKKDLVGVTESVDPCGAGSPGGAGFEKGNTCAKSNAGNLGDRDSHGLLSFLSIPKMTKPVFLDELKNVARIYYSVPKSGDKDSEQNRLSGLFLDEMSNRAEDIMPKISREEILEAIGKGAESALGQSVGMRDAIAMKASLVLGHWGIIERPDSERSYRIADAVDAVAVVDDMIEKDVSKQVVWQCLATALRPDVSDDVFDKAMDLASIKAGELAERKDQDSQDYAKKSQATIEEIKAERAAGGSKVQLAAKSMTPAELFAERERLTRVGKAKEAREYEKIIATSLVQDPKKFFASTSYTGSHDKSTVDSIFDTEKSSEAMVAAYNNTAKEIAGQYDAASPVSLRWIDDIPKAKTRDDGVSLKFRVVAKDYVAETIAGRMSTEVGQEDIAKFNEHPEVARSKQWSSIEDTGDAKAMAGLLVEGWASSSTREPISVAVQMAVANRFGLPESTLAGTTASVLDKASDLYSKNKKVFDSYVAASYQQTQDWLKKAGVDNLTLYRVISSDVESITNTDASAASSEAARDGLAVLTKKPNASYLGEGYIDAETKELRRKEHPLWVSDQSIKMNPLSSFSHAYSATKPFALTGKTLSSSVLVAKVPAENIFSIPLTGPGCVTESEVVVVGKPIVAKKVTAGLNSYIPDDAGMLQEVLKSDGPEGMESEDSKRLDELMAIVKRRYNL